jgi:hypothetical protein
MKQVGFRQESSSFGWDWILKGVVLTWLPILEV